MARQTQRGEWNQRLFDERALTGLTVNQAVFKAWNLLPEGVSRKAPKMLERYEKDWQEEKADPVFLAALADVYDRPLSALSELAAERLDAMSLLGISSRTRSRCLSDYADQPLFAMAG